MAKDKKKGKGAPTNNTGRPTGSYNSYATSGYGNSYGYGASGGAYGRSPYGAPQGPSNGANVTNVNNSPAQGKGKKKVEKVDLPEKMTRKQKKVAKKAEKFDETDLRCYPMTVGAWIGTFILLAIPLINIICCICWFFGVGNKSRTAWIRSYVVIVLIIVIVLGIILGVGYSVLSKNAKNEGYEGFNGTIYYAGCKVIDMLGGVIGDEETVAGIKEMLAEALGFGESAPEEGANGGESGGVVDGGGNEYIESGEPLEQAA